jgi:hypothetical protein
MHLALGQTQDVINQGSFLLSPYQTHKTHLIATLLSAFQQVPIDSLIEVFGRFETVNDVHRGCHVAFLLSSQYLEYYP